MNASVLQDIGQCIGKLSNAGNHFTKAAPIDTVLELYSLSPELIVVNHYTFIVMH